MRPPPDLMIPTDQGELARRQAEGRRRAVAQARQAPFFARALRGVDPDRADEPAEWAKIPVLDKEQLRALSPEAFYRDFCIATRAEVGEYWRSGGSTGRPLFYPRTAEDLRYAMVGFMRVLDAAGFSDEDVAHMSLPLGIHPAGHLMARAGAELGLGMVWAGGGNTLPSAAQLELVRLFAPSAWIGMASYGIQLANLAKSEDIDLASIGVRKILCTAEPLSDAKRGRLASLWGAEVRDCFGMTEMMMTGGEVEPGGGFRFWSDFCYPEVLDPDTHDPVPEGEAGLLVVTSLVTNNATPFIRWNTGDIVTMRPARASGGKYDVFPAVTHTRRTSGFVKVSGVNIGFTDFEDAMLAAPEVSDFRVEAGSRDGADELILHVELVDGAAVEAASEALAARVRRIFDLTPRVRIAERGEVARSFEGSFKPPRFSDRRV